MENILTLCAALSAGIAATCLSAVIIGLLQEVQIDREAASREVVHQLPIYFRFLMIFSPNVMKIVRKEWLNDMRKQAGMQLMMAGYDRNLTADQFLAIRLLSVFFGVLFCFLLLAQGHGTMGLLLLLLLTIYPSTWLKSAIAKRHTAILKSLPNLLDLLTLSVEAGKDFLTALRDILAKRKPDAIGEEFTRTLQEIQLGKKRQTALKEMGERVRQPELLSVLHSIVQADEMGVSIGQVLRIQSDQMRAKRFSMAEKLANEAPVKILFPVVVFIFPSVFLMLMGPVILRMLNLVG